MYQEFNKAALFTKSEFRFRNYFGLGYLLPGQENNKNIFLKFKANVRLDRLNKKLLVQNKSLAQADMTIGCPIYCWLIVVKITKTIFLSWLLINRLIFIIDYQCFTKDDKRII